MIRYRCIKCGEYCRGGADTFECPICKGDLQFCGVIK